jgi:hypothetical protein
LRMLQQGSASRRSGAHLQLRMHLLCRLRGASPRRIMPELRWGSRSATDAGRRRARSLPRLDRTPCSRGAVPWDARMSGGPRTRDGVGSSIDITPTAWPSGAHSCQQGAVSRTAGASGT